MTKAFTAVVLLLLAIPAAGAVQAQTILEELELRRYYLEEGVDASIAEMEDLVDRYPSVYFVALAGDLGLGTDSFADQLLDQLGDGTVVVLTPSEMGAVSSDFDDAGLDLALERAADTPGSTYVEDFSELAGALRGESAAGPEPTPAGGFPWVAAVVGVCLVGGLGLVMWGSNRRRERAQADLFEEARTEIRQQMDVIATQIVELADDPRTDVNDQAQEHYRQASEVFQQAESRLVAATSLDQLEDLSDDLDRARWQLEATTALIEGRELPPEPVEQAAPPPCFFDPTHGAGRIEAEIQTATGTRKVLVCEADAAKLRAGSAPDPRQIPYDHQPLPAPRAPRTHGGLGMDWLDVFSILVGGMANRRDYDWTGPRTSGRPRLPRPRGRGTASRGSRGRSRRSR